MRDTILVTGATGFVGRRLTTRLVSRGERVLLALRHPERAPAGLGAIQWDLESGELSGADLRRVAAIVHSAAYLPPNMHDSAYAAACMERNALGTLRLMRAAAEAAVPTVINFGSGNAYRDRGCRVDEDAPLFPSRQAPYYLASKVVQEIFGEHIAAQYGFRLVTLRPAAVYGPGMTAAGLVPTFASRLLAGDAVRIDDGGRYSVDLVFVDDVVQAAVAALDLSVSGPFNVGSGRLVSSLEVARELARILGAPERLLQVMPEGDRPPGGFALLDITRAKAQLGYEATSLAAGLEVYVDSLRKRSCGQVVAKV